MSAAPAPPLPRIAWRVFAPLDAAINIAINGGIAWWLYGGSDEIPLTGPAGLTMMALPMTFILSAATTYFGVWNAVRERRAGRVEPALGVGASWKSSACTEAVATGVVAWLLAVGAAWLLGRFNPDARVGPVTAVSGIATYAGVVAFLLHGRAVIRGGSLRSGRDSSARIERSA